MSSKRVVQYDADMNIIEEYASQKIAIEKTGISKYRIQKSIKNNQPVDGYFFKIDNETTPYYQNIACPNCGKIFLCAKQRLEKSKNVCCSRKCSAEHKKNALSKNCKCCICGKEFHKKPSTIQTHNACSKECISKMRSMLMEGENNSQYGLKGELNASWKSNERISYYGYKLIRSENHPFRNSDGFVFEHRLVAEKYLLNNINSINIDGKLYLSPEFHVHHIDFDRLNNDVNNLYVLPKGLHIRFHNSLKDIVRNATDGTIIAIKKKEYSKEELKTMFYEFIDNETSYKAS